MAALGDATTRELSQACFQLSQQLSSMTALVQQLTERLQTSQNELQAVQGAISADHSIRQQLLHYVTDADILSKTNKLFSLVQSRSAKEANVQKLRAWLSLGVANSSYLPVPPSALRQWQRGRGENGVAMDAPFV